jgi:ParB/RepB/Spo0J family partition protein
MIKLHKEVKVLKLSKIKEAEINSNQLTEVEYEKLKEDITKNGFVDPVKVRKTGEDAYELIDGHHRYRAMAELGAQEITAIILDNDESQAKLNAIRFNTERGNQNQKLLATIVKSLNNKGVGLLDIERELVYNEPELKDSLALLDLPEDLEQIIKDARDKEEEELPVIYSFVVKKSDAEIIDEIFDRFDKRGAVLATICRKMKEAQKSTES